MKRIIKIVSSICLSIVLVASIQLVVTASGNNMNSVGDEIIYSEFDMYWKMKNTDREVLLRQGNSEELVDWVKSNSYEEELYRRSQLPTEILEFYGYSDEEINLLRDYGGEVLTPESPLAEASAICTGNSTVNSIDFNTTNIKYEFHWNKCPVYKGNDAMGLAWSTANQDGGSLACTITNKFAYVTYTCIDKPDVISVYDVDDQNSFTYGFTKFPVYYTVIDGIVREYWAKEGVMLIGLQKRTSSGSTAGFGSIEIIGGYGHSTGGGQIGISVGISGSGVSLSLSFTPTSSVETLALSKVYRQY